MSAGDHALLAPILAAAVGWRRHLHRHPELGFDVPDTARFVAEKLRSFDLDRVDADVGGGVVGILEGHRQTGGTIALRAEMDALPIVETNRFEHASKYPGRMHACGHDGHMAMLLAAAAFLARQRDQIGRVAFVFQPAEEGDAGALAMLESGLVGRYGISHAVALHNRPGVAQAAFSIHTGPVMAGADRITFLIHAAGGHAALPHLTADPVIVGSSIVLECQLIVSRNVSPLQSAVLTIPVFEAGTARNVIPRRVRLHGTLRTFDHTVREVIHEKLRRLAEAQAIFHGTDIEVDIEAGYPAVINDADVVAWLSSLADGSRARPEAAGPMMASDDFSYILNEIPGAYVFIGNGPSAGLHEAGYDFCDDILPAGAGFWISCARNHHRIDPKCLIAGGRNPVLGSRIGKAQDFGAVA